MSDQELSNGTPTPTETANKRFRWLQNGNGTGRRNPFVNPRPQLGRESSTTDLVSRENSRTDLFQNSRITFFDSPPKPEATKPGCCSGAVSGFSLWRDRSIIERILLGVSSCLLTLVVVLIAILVSMKKPRPIPIFQESDLCLSESCIYSASEVLRSLDESKNPCDDFYEFACGGWVKNNPIPDGKSQWGIFSKMELRNQLIIRNALERVESKNKEDAEFKAKVYYNACLDNDEVIEELGAKPLLEVVSKLGGWSLLNHTSTKWNLQAMLQALQNTYNLGGLFNWAIMEDERNSSKHVIVLDQGGLNLPTRDYYLNKTVHQKVLDAYLEYMTEICVLLGANKTEAQAQMAKVIEFETDLANITTPAEDRRDEELMYNPMTVSAFQKTAPYINWLDFFNDAFRTVNKTITEKERLVIYEPNYFKKLATVIEKYQTDDEGQKTITSYMMWQASRSLSTYLSKAFRDATKVLRKALYGSEGTEEFWRYCVTETNNAIGFAVGAMFVKEVFDVDSKRQGEQMINNIRTAFKENLKNLEWMDAETRKSAEVKADAITDMIGFPDYILSKPDLNEQYSELTVKPNEYFNNNLASSLFSLKEDLRKLDKPVNKTKWGMTPSTVNAYYTPTKNQIAFPAGILQLPFYDGNNPKSVNYGAMGVVMGHELTHAFDDQGREYDRYGNLNQWWNNATVDQFKNRAQCIQNQYSSYDIDGQHLNGKQTLGENIADNGGLKASFHAYLEYSRDVQKNITLPGLKYNHRQIFFISFAQVWCSAMTKEATKLQIEKDDHTIARYRVIGTLSNLKEFSTEFNCPLGSKMNPKNKCEVW